MLEAAGAESFQDPPANLSLRAGTGVFGEGKFPAQACYRREALPHQEPRLISLLANQGVR